MAVIDHERGTRADGKAATALFRATLLDTEPPPVKSARFTSVIVQFMEEVPEQVEGAEINAAENINIAARGTQLAYLNSHAFNLQM